MYLLILAENLEINRTSSGLRSHKQLLAYQKIFNNIDVITSTPKQLLHQINGVNYNYINVDSDTSLSSINNLPKSVSIQNFLFGLDITIKKQIKAWESITAPFISKNKYDIVVSLSSGTNFVAAYALYYLKNKYVFKHLMFVHDPFPLNQYPPPYQQKSGLAYKSIAKLFGRVLNSADILSFPSLRLKEWMIAFYPDIKTKSIIQPHIGMSLKTLKRHLPKKPITMPKFPQGINIVHTGTLLGPRNPLYIVGALEKLFLEIPESKGVVHLHIIGKVSKEWNVDHLKSKNVYVHPKRFSYFESLEIQKKADVLLLIEAVSNVSPFMPGKLADYLMAKKPILALTPKSSETTRILGENYSLTVENGNIEEITRKLILIFNAFKYKFLSDLRPNKKSIHYVSVENWHRLTKESIGQQ